VVLLVVFAKLCGQILASHGEVLWMAFWGFWWLFFLLLLVVRDGAFGGSIKGSGGRCG
jgi:hypothetical protein